MGRLAAESAGVFGRWTSSPTARSPSPRPAWDGWASGRRRLPAAYADDA